MSGTLTHNPADVVRYLIVALAKGSLHSSNTSWPVFYPNEPDSPNEAIFTASTQGNKFGRLQADGEVQEDYGVQIKVRSLGFQTGWEKINAIMVALDEDVRQMTVTISPNSYVVHVVSRTSGPIPLGRESPTSQRYIHTLNVTASIRQNP